MSPRSVAAAGLMLALAGSASAQQAPGTAAEPTHVLVLGTYHFANPGLDVVKTEVADVLSPDRQAEIGRVVDALERFRPTHVVVEQRPEQAPVLDSLYAAYRAGAHELTRNETQQVGFRLAARLGHPRVYPFDHPGEFPWGPLMAHVQQHEPERAAWIGRTLAEIGAEAERRQRDWTIPQILRATNHPDTLAQEHGRYVSLGRAGAGGARVGADLLAAWYARNIHMFGNLQALAEPGARLLVVVGSAHAPILRELVLADPDMWLVEAVDYLR